MKKTQHIRLSGSIKEMAVSTVMAHIGEDRYSAIKRADEHPVFIGMLVAYEGPSAGQMETFDDYVALNDPNLVPIKWWSSDAVWELAYRMNLDSPKLVIGHDDPETRDEGDVLSGFVAHNPKENNIPEAFGVAYVRSEMAKAGVKSGELDAVSVEADVIMLVGQQNQVEIETVTKVDAVALGNREKMPPGFQRASVEAVVTEFKATIKETDTMDINEMTKNQLLEHPSVAALVREQNQTTYEDYKKEREKAETAQARVTELETALSTAKDKLKAAGSSVNKDRIATIVTSELESKKLPKAQKVALKSKLQDTITVDDPEISDNDLKARVTSVLNAEVEYLEGLNKEMGIKNDDEDKGDKGSKSTDKGESEDEEDEDKKDAFLTENPVDAAA